MSLDPRIVDSLRRTVAMLHQIEEVLDRLDPDHDSELHEAIEHVDEVIERAEGNSTWREFIDGHPELTVPTRLEFTDDEVCDALVEIHAQEWYGRQHEVHLASLELRRAFNFPSASGVRRLLMQRKGLDHLTEWSHSDLMRVVAALKRLEKAGRVVQEVNYVYGQRRSAIGTRPLRPSRRRGRTDVGSTGAGLRAAAGCRKRSRPTRLARPAQPCVSLPTPEPGRARRRALRSPTRPPPFAPLAVLVSAASAPGVWLLPQRWPSPPAQPAGAGCRRQPCRDSLPATSQSLRCGKRGTTSSARRDNGGCAGTRRSSSRSPQ
jgi:hypothetical protein